jgi:UDP-2-acetamido-2,6-beta-L-arabino-hexul-4-ose reductase
MKILVTGALGFMGRNICAVLRNDPEFQLLEYDVEHTPDDLRRMLLEAGFILHLAGVNRPRDERDFDLGNRKLTEDMLNILEESGKNPGFLLSSSIHAAGDTPYGISKRRAEEAVRVWGERTGALATIYRLPNTFGKWCRPNYNSVVATWCHAVANDLPVRLDDPEKILPLVYIDDVVAEFLRCIRGAPSVGPDGFATVSEQHPVRLGDLLGLLRSFRSSREDLHIPDFSDRFTQALYATYLSYLPEGAFAYDLKMRSDNRGWLAEFLKSPAIGQIFVSVTKPGITRGNHWHHTKTEKFLVVSGEAVVRFRQIDSGETTEYRVTGDCPQPIDIPPGYTHHLVNTGENDLVTLFWASEILNPEKPDTLFQEV